MMSWLRRSFITGIVVTVPLFVTVAALVWLFRVIDGYTTPLSERLFSRHVPGLGIVATAAGILLVGAIATNVIGRRLLKRGENILLRVPVFRTIYGPVKELVMAFSPDNESGFKQVVILDGQKGTTLGFLTKEFTVDRGQGPEPFLAVYVPTNHLYMGDILICERSRAAFPDITVEEGVRIFLTGGTAFPSRVRGMRDNHPPRDFRV